MWGREAEEGERRSKAAGLWLVREETRAQLGQLQKNKTSENKQKSSRRSSAPPSPPDEAGSRSHPPCFSAPREEKGELADADSKNENNFQKEILECGQEAWQKSGSRRHCWSFPSMWVGGSAG